MTVNSKKLVLLFIGSIFTFKALSAILPIVEDPVGVSRSRENFVLDVLGISEKDFAKQSPIDRKKTFDAACKKHSFSPGTFQQQSLEELESKVFVSTKKSGAFHVIVGENPLAKTEVGGSRFCEGVKTLNNPLVLQQLDTGSLQAAWGKHCQEKGMKLTSMVASNSNGLETTSEDDVPSDITRYIHDHTQGPAASISAASGTLLRHYFAFPEEENSQRWQQGTPHQINFLDDLLAQFETQHEIEVTVPNGYLKLPTDKAQLDLLASFFEKNKHLIKVGVHTDVSVSHGFSDGNSHRCLANPKDRSLINQIFCAALDLGQSTNKPAVHVNRSAAEKIAKILLTAQIQATLLAAWKNNTDILLLPLLGCGAFGNRVEWLIEALESCTKIIHYSGMHVVLNLFDGKNIDAKLQAQLLKLVKKTQGSYRKFKQEDDELIVNDLYSAPQKHTAIEHDEEDNEEVEAQSSTKVHKKAKKNVSVKNVIGDLTQQSFKDAKYTALVCSIDHNFLIDINSSVSDENFGGLVKALFEKEGTKNDEYRLARSLKKDPAYGTLLSYETAIVCNTKKELSPYAHTIIFVSGPDCRKAQERHQKEKFLEQTVFSCLAKASENNLQYIALPLISTGLCEYPEDEAEKAITKACESFFSTNQDSSIKEVRIVKYAE